MLKKGLGGERTKDLSLKVFEVSSDVIGVAIALVRTAKRQRRSFILLVDSSSKGNKDPVCGAANRAYMWK